MSRRNPSEESRPLLRSISPTPISEDADPYDAEASHNHDLLQSTPILKIGAAMYSFVVLGLFTSSVGVMLPHLSKAYTLTDIQVSTIFLVQPLGYISAAQSNAWVHERFGQRGVALLGPTMHIAAAIAIALHPAFPVLLAAFAVMAAGNGILDGSWCSMAAATRRANFVSGLLHGSFSGGAAVGPFLAGTLMVKWQQPWWMWYRALAVASMVEIAILSLAFRASAAPKSRLGQTKPSQNPQTSPYAMLRHTSLWIAAFYFLTYGGNETAISGWIVSFMSRARHASPYMSNISSSGFWGGMALGRLVLGHVTDTIGVRRATTAYFVFAVALQLLFTLTSSVLISVVSMTILGFVMGPIFPSGVVVLTQLLPKEQHVAAVSFIASVGQIGGAGLPFAIGVVVQKVGIGLFGWVVLVFTTAALCVWIGFASLRVQESKDDGGSGVSMPP